MMKTKISLLLLCVFCAFSCMSSDAIKGNGTIITKKIPVENFTELRLGSKIESKGNSFSSKSTPRFNYTQTTGSSSLEITMDENLFDNLVIDQKDGRLTIRGERGTLRPTQLIINGSSSDLKDVSVSACMDFVAESPVNFEDVSFDVSGVGDVRLSALSSDKFRCGLSGVGKVYLTGQIKEGRFDVSGVGHVYAFDCPVENLKCGVSGVGGMEVNAAESLNASTSGVGSIKYKGHPKELKKSASGVGSVKQVD